MDDPAKARELWSPFLKAWFPQGLDDPDLVLIRVEVESAEFWDVASKKMMTLFRLAQGFRQETHGDHAHAHLSLLHCLGNQLPVGIGDQAQRQRQHIGMLRYMGTWYAAR